MLTRNRRSRVVSDNVYPDINDQQVTAEKWLAKYAPANDAMSAARSGNAEREAAAKTPLASKRRDRLAPYLRPWPGPQVENDANDLVEPKGVSGGQATEEHVGMPVGGWMVDVWPQLFPRFPAWTARRSGSRTEAITGL
jgi:hypothetical protein